MFDVSDPKTLKFAAFIAGLTLMYTAETIFTDRMWEDSRAKRLSFHVVLAALNTAVVRLVLVLVPLMYFARYLHHQGWGIVSYLGVSGVSEIALTVLVFDLLDYWWHRWNHRLPFLWRFHKVHHTDTHCDSTTALRFHFGELILSFLFKGAGIAIWGPSVWAFVIFEICVTAASQFHHSNLDFPDTVEHGLRTVIVTPRFHVSHHTVSRRTGNNNFATIFILWDHLFGTYRKPDREEMQYLGLPYGRDTDLSLKDALTRPLQKDEIESGDFSEVKQKQ